jgi:hypothetical protein
MQFVCHWNKISTIQQMYLLIHFHFLACCSQLAKVHINNKIQPNENKTSLQ